MTIFTKAVKEIGFFVCGKCRKEYLLDYEGLKSLKKHYNFVHSLNNYKDEKYRKKISESLIKRHKEDKEFVENYIKSGGVKI